ncbi:MAG: hypothetical protein HC847_09040 [Hydrococcus sp. RU_2_2]|nr:hypothetical protein [Hydrococcus sp. RU_2_2]
MTVTLKLKHLTTPSAEGFACCAIASLHHAQTAIASPKTKPTEKASLSAEGFVCGRSHLSTIPKLRSHPSKPNLPKKPA